jgi:hypothetical protein
MNEKPMIMRFADTKLAWQYVHLCGSLGFKPIQGRDGRWFTVSTMHPNRASRRFLIQKWANQSCVVYESATRRDRRQLDLFDEGNNHPN